MGSAGNLSKVKPLVPANPESEAQAPGPASSFPHSNDARRKVWLGPGSPFGGSAQVPLPHQPGAVLGERGSRSTSWSSEADLSKIHVN